MSKVAQVGQSQFGQLAFNESYVLSDHQDVVFSDGRMRTHKGWGYFGKRGYSKPELWEIPESSVPSDTIADISIISVSGALVGKIRTDIQYSIVKDIEFTLDEHGCADFVLKLNRLPDFPILSFSLISVNIGNTSFNWYSGEIAYKDDQGTQQDFYVFRGTGVRDRLEKLRAETTYTAGQDVGQIFADLAQTWVVPYAPINYNASKIDQSTGVIIANDIELSKLPLSKVFQTLSDMASYNWGVDGDRDLYFESKSTTTKRTFFIGYSVQSFEPKLNLTDIRNVITVQRQEGLGGGGAGWSVAGVYNDASSAKKYGRKELNYQIPGFFEDDEADIVGNALIAEKAEPQQSGKMKGFKVIGEDEFLERGLYRFILPFDKFEKIYSDVDEVSDWTKTGSGDLAISKEEDIFVYGDGCIKLEYSDALNDRIQYNASCNVGKIQKIRFYIRADKTGSFMTVGVGNGAWDQNTVDIDIGISSVFFNYDWDVSALDIDIIDRIAFRIDEGPTDATVVYIDKIEFEITGNRFYSLNLKETKYMFEPGNQTASADFGVLPPRMENYIAGLFQVSSELRFTQEIR